MPDIFVSYSREDRPRAETFARAFESEGWSVWWDRTIPAGKTFDEVIEENLDAAECMVVLWSKRSVASRWVRTEAGEAANRDILVPVLIEPCTVPLAFRRIQAADLSLWRGDRNDPEYRRLVDAIAGVVGTPRSAAPGVPAPAGAGEISGEAGAPASEPPPAPPAESADPLAVAEPAPKRRRRWPLPGPPAAWLAAAVLAAGLVYFVTREQPAERSGEGGSGSVPAVEDVADGRPPSDGTEAEPDAGGPSDSSGQDGGPDAGPDAAPPEARPGDVIRDCPTCPELVVIPGGSFTMGSPPGEAGRDETEGPQRQVTVQPFALGRYEVTRREFAAAGLDPSACRVFDGQWRDDSGKSWRDPGFEQTGGHPVVCVSWDDAQRYLEWLSREAGETYRLPTEAEWEYAARAGFTGALQPQKACLVANVADRTAAERYGWQGVHDCTDGYVHTSPVGTFAANRFGLSDVLGNAYEWVADCWVDTYVGVPIDGSARADGDCSVRTVRGGSWVNLPPNARYAHRFGFIAGTRGSGIGFRVARDLP